MKLGYTNVKLILMYGKWIGLTFVLSETVNHKSYSPLIIHIYRVRE